MTSTYCEIAHLCTGHIIRHTLLRKSCSDLAAGVDLGLSILLWAV